MHVPYTFQPENSPRRMERGATFEMTPMDTLKQTLQNDPDVIFAVLIGSRAMNTNQDNSDWDIAIQWRRELDFLTKLERIETLRHNLAEQFHTTIDKIDLIDITTARLAMRAEIADHGVLLAGDNTLPWSHFLLRTWRELEEFYWDRNYAV